MQFGIAVHFGITAQLCGHREAERAGAAAQIDDHRGGRASQRSGGLDEELAAAPRHEHPGIHEDPQAAELRPADHLLERQPAGSLLHQRVELGRGSRGLREQPRLVFREHAPGGAQPRHHGLVDGHIPDYFG